MTLKDAGSWHDAWWGETCLEDGVCVIDQILDFDNELWHPPRSLVWHGMYPVVLAQCAQTGRMPGPHEKLVNSENHAKIQIQAKP